MSNRRPAEFVLVHGAWAGAWSCARVIDRLMAQGHRIHVPTLSGLGERCHLAGREINLTTHVNDIVNEVLWKDLNNIVLVGLSYGGLVITGAAEKLGERISSIVYVDAFIPADGQSFADITGWSPDGEMIAPPSMPAGAFANESDRAWVASKVTPQPVATFKEKLRVSGAYQRVPNKTYVHATGWAGPFGSLVKALQSDSSWSVLPLDCGHDVPNLMPNELAAILHGCAEKLSVEKPFP